MRGFVDEGRLAPHSLVAREGTADWHEARDEPEFTDVFAHRGGHSRHLPPANNVARLRRAHSRTSADAATSARTDTASRAIHRGCHRRPR